jgi:hypothetical protein
MFLTLDGANADAKIVVRAQMAFNEWLDAR